MDSGNVTLTISFEERAGPLAISDVVEGTKLLLQWLEVAQAWLWPSRSTPARWILLEWHHSIPTMVVAPGAPDPAAIQAAQHVYSTLKMCANESVVNIAIPEERIFRRLARLADRLELGLQLNQEPVVFLGPSLKRVLERMPMESETEGILEGVLGSVTVYHKRLFALWSTATGRRVEVQFPATLKSEVVSNLGKLVRVRGRVTYRGRYPIRMAATTLEAMHEDGDFPLDHFFGIGRDWFDKRPSGVLTRELWGGSDE